MDNDAAFMSLLAERCHFRDLPYNFTGLKNIWRSNFAEMIRSLQSGELYEQKALEFVLRQSLIKASSVLEKILKSGLTETESGGKIPIMDFSTVRNLVTLRALMEWGAFPRTMEIGLAQGGSALTLASLHREQGRPPEGQHVAIDPLQRDIFQDAGLWALERDGLSAYVQHISECSQTALPAMWKETRKFDLIYIDGNHSFDDVFVDFYFCDRLLETQGVLVFDDCADPRVRKVTQFICRNYAEAYKEVKLEELFVQDRPLRLRLARLLGRNQVRVFQRYSDTYRKWNSPLVAF